MEEAIEETIEHPEMQYEESTGDYEIRVYPNPVLSEIAEPLAEEEFGPEIVKLGRQMLALAKGKGVGLAATQIGLLKRVIVVCPEEDVPGITICNPTLTYSPTTDFAQEGCLSLPGVYNQVERSTDICVDYRTPLGEPRHEYYSGMAARVIQHETDHLDGKMFFDRMGRNLRRQTLRAWDEQVRVTRKREEHMRVHDIYYQAKSAE